MRNTPVSIFKDLFKSTDVPYIVTLEKCLQRIKQGTSKDLIEKIREGNKELKKKLPSILFAGEFSERKGSGLITHSGLMIVDFDKFPTHEDMSDYLELLKANKHFVSLFISPSGMGIKGIVRVPNTLDKQTHPKYFKAFQEEYEYEYFDMANSDVNRVCFESYDPNTFINYDAEIYDPVIKDEGFHQYDRTPILPITNEDHIIDRIMKWGWNKDFREGERNAFVFDLAGAFCEYGVSESAAIGYISSNIVIGDFSEREMLTAIKSGYKKRDFDTKYFEDYSTIDKIKHDLKNGKEKIVSKYKITEDTYDSIREEKEHEDFWYYEKEKCKIDPLKYKWFLERNGFKKYFPANSQKPTWVSIKSNIVQESSVEKIKDFVLGYLLDNQEFDVWKLASNYGNLFSEQFLLMLDSIELQMLKDQKYKSFIAFQNGILEVTKDEYKLVEYIDVDGYVWEDQIIKRDFVKTDNNDNEYKTFVNNISNKEPEAIECAIGYLLSTYKNKMNNKVIILNDEVISDNPEGGTGKGLFVQGLKQIRKVSIVDGKDYEDKKSFANQTVSQATQIFVLDDVSRNFNLEKRFSLITEGITLERKNKDAIKLDVEDSPKMVISTNYAIKGEGNSHDRRRHELEFAQFYGEKLTPYDEFGHQLFDDWLADQFTNFDNYMVHCLQSFLRLGLIKQQAKNIKMRKLIAETSMEFYEWISEDSNFPYNIRKNKQEAFTEFTNDYKDFQKWLNRKTFNIWVKKYATFIGVKYNDGNTNGDRWFMLKTDDVQILDEIEF